MKRIVLLVVLAVTFAFISDLAAYPGGIAGRTLKSGSTGCGSCHTQNSALTGSVTGPDTVLAGATVNYTITYSSSNSGSYGVDIAAQLGTLGVGSSSAYLKLLNSELVQKNGLSVTTMTFSYTAPSTQGLDAIYSTVDKGHSGRWNFLANKHIYVKLASSIHETGLIAEKFNLYQNYPNPFNPVTNINFSIPKSGFVNLQVYNSIGEKISDLVNSNLSSGTYSVPFDAADLASGIYYYRITVLDADGTSQQYADTKKMILLK